MQGDREKINITDFFKLQSLKEKIKFLLVYATYAPSSHNTQPWLFKIISNDILEIHPNLSRLLLNSDPTKRELYLSVGAAIGNLLLASEAYGLKYEINKQKIQNQLIISVKFSDTKISPEQVDYKTLQAIIDRHTNRDPYKEDALPQDILKKINSLAKEGVKTYLVREQNLKNQISELVQKATHDAFCDKNFTKELSKWIKPSLKKFRDGMTGYNLRMPFLFSLVMPWAISHLPMAGLQVKMVKKMLETAPAILIISASSDDSENQLLAGETLSNISVEMQKLNISLGIFGAPIEIGSYNLQLQKLLSSNTIPLIFCRIGFIKTVPPRAPRLALEEVIIQ